MNLTIYMSVIPGIIYGMALVELIKIYRHQSRYWETNLMGFFLFLVLITNRYLLFPVLDDLFQNMAVFTLYMLSPLIFLQACFVLTPEKEEDVAIEHFNQRRKSFFLLLAIFIAGNVLLETVFSAIEAMIYLRLLGVVLFLLCAFINNKMLRVITYVFVAVAIGRTYWPSITALF
jgi:hypothetical protein